MGLVDADLRASQKSENQKAVNAEGSRSDYQGKQQKHPMDDGCTQVGTDHLCAGGGAYQRAGCKAGQKIADNKKGANRNQASIEPDYCHEAACQGYQGPAHVDTCVDAPVLKALGDLFGQIPPRIPNGGGNGHCHHGIVEIQGRGDWMTEQKKEHNDCCTGCGGNRQHSFKGLQFLAVRFGRSGRSNKRQPPCACHGQRKIACQQQHDTYIAIPGCAQLAT